MDPAQRLAHFTAVFDDVMQEHLDPGLRDEFRASMASELAAWLLVLPAGEARIAGFNSLVELAGGIADPAARGQVVRALAIKLLALPAGEARVAGFNSLEELVGGIPDAAAREQVAQALASGLWAFARRRGAHRRVRPSSGTGRRHP